MRLRDVFFAAVFSAGFAATNVFAQSWEQVEVATLEEPTIAFQLGGRDILRLSCQSRGVLRISLVDRMATPRKTADGFEVKQILLDVGGELSSATDLKIDEDGMAFADIADTRQFFQSTRSVLTNGGWLWIREAGGHWGAGPFGIHYGLSQHLTPLEKACSLTETEKGAALTTKNVVRVFEPIHLAEAKKHVVKLDCENAANAPFCADPTLSVLLEELPQAAAAAIARMPSGEEMVQNFYGYTASTMEQYSACGTDIPCLGNVMKERISVWDSLFVPFTEEELEALPKPGPGYDCTTTIHPAQKAICTSEEMSQRHREMLNLIDGLIQKTEGTAIGERTKQRIERQNFEGSKFMTYHVGQDARILRQLYDRDLQRLQGDFSSRVQTELQQLQQEEEQARIAEEERLRAEQERVAQEQGEAAEESRIAEQNAAWEAEQEIRKAAHRRQHMTDQPPRTINTGDQKSESEVVLLLPPANPNTFSGASGFFEEDFKTRIFNRKGKNAVRRLEGKDVTRALHSDTAIDPFLALLDPAKFNKQQTRNAWMTELYDHWRSGDSELFDPELDQALSAVGAILECTYDRYFHPDIPGNNSNSWTTPKLLFWSMDVPEELSPSALKRRETPNAAPHPLLMIGPKVPSCPTTLGEGIQLVAGQLGDMLDPALLPAALSSAKPQGSVTSMTDPRQKLIRDLLGMSVIETASNSEGVFAGYRNLEIDHIAPDGPAFAAGFRSGDYLWHLGWNETTTVAELATELEKREFETAIVLTRIYGEGIDDADARLIIFDPEPETEFGHIPRIGSTDEESKHGLSKFAEDEYSVGMWLPEGQWCADQVVGELHFPLDPLQASLPPSTGLLNAIASMHSSCPALQTIRFVYWSTLVDAPIETWVIDVSSDQPKFSREGLDGLPHGSSVSAARKIAEQHAPLCDQLTAHPADRKRRYGLEGTEFILAQDLERAINLCIDEMERRPGDPVLSFQLGRALFEAGLSGEALPFLEAAALDGHGIAADYLGQMYLSGEGVDQDYELSDAYFAQAEAAGFNPFPDEVAEQPFDASGTARPMQIASTYKMSIRMNPLYLDGGVAVDYERDTPEFLYFMLESFAEFCSDPPTLSKLETALSEVPDDPALRHAMHIYGTYLPTLLPTLKAKIGTSKSIEDWGSSYKSASVLEGRYSCGSAELRQFLVNSVELIMR